MREWYLSFSATQPPQETAPPARGGMLRVVSGGALDKWERDREQAMVAAAQPAPAHDLAHYIRTQWEVMRRHRNTAQRGGASLNERLLKAQRMFEGEYDPGQLMEIRKFGGSEVYSRLVATKCRGATALLRDVYLGSERPWDIQAAADPDVPPEVRANILSLVSSEAQTLQMAGQPVLQDQMQMRLVSLMHSAKQAAKRRAQQQATAVADKIEEILGQGDFYSALTQFLTDLPLFQFAVLKGPIVRMVPTLTWEGGKPTMRTKPRMFWSRVSPFDFYWSPGADNIADADIIERKRLTRNDLNDLIGVPGYDEKAIRAVLEEYASGGLREWMDATDVEQALNEGRENPDMNSSKMIDCIEFHGSVQGRVLLEEGVKAKLIPDPDRDYQVQSWVIGRHTIKTQLNPSPRQRHPYYLTSFEKVPGTVHGHGLPDLIEDLQGVANAALRSAVNNMAIASGPQVVINTDVISPTENADELYPWKRWHYQSDPMANQREPVTFFQPASNAQELMGIYQAVSNIADENSAIPRYITGSERTGGAGRTASGLSMLMGNAQKVMQTVASNVDGDVMEPLLENLYDLLMLTDTSGLLTGQEQIRVRGVNVAVQQETERQKQLQFLQITANPIDAPIVGEVGRARVLRAVAAGLGLPDDVVPDDATLQAKADAAQRQQAAQSALAGALGGAPPGAPPSGEGAPSPGSAAAGSQAPAATPARLSDHAPPNAQFRQGMQP